MDTFYKGFIAVLGGFVGFLFGGWSILLTILSFLVIIDYGSGLAAAGVNGEIKAGLDLLVSREKSLFS